MVKSRAIYVLSNAGRTSVRNSDKNFHQPHPAWPIKMNHGSYSPENLVHSYDSQLCPDCKPYGPRVIGRDGKCSRINSLKWIHPILCLCILSPMHANFFSCKYPGEHDGMCQEEPFSFHLLSIKSMRRTLSHLTRDKASLSSETVSMSVLQCQMCYRPFNCSQQRSEICSIL